MLQFLKIFHDNHDKPSLKRFVAFLLIACLIFVVVADVMYKKTVEQFIFSGLTDALIWTLGFIGGEELGKAAIPMIGKRPGSGFIEPPTNNNFINEGGDGNNSQNYGT